MSNSETPLVGIVMGSESDWPVMEATAAALKEFDIPFETRVMSAHRTPHTSMEYAESAQKRGLKVIIAGAGGAAHLAGVLAAHTPLPIIGIPVPSKYLKGMDSLLSVVQMPSGVPVATVAIGGAKNAGILAAQIIATGNPALSARVTQFKKDMIGKVEQMDARVQALADGI